MGQCPPLQFDILLSSGAVFTAEKVKQFSPSIDLWIEQIEVLPVDHQQIVVVQVAAVATCEADQEVNVRQKWHYWY